MGGWGGGFAACVVCDSDARRYWANGLCAACHSRVHNNIRRRAQRRNDTGITRMADRLLVVLAPDGAIAYLITSLHPNADAGRAIAAFAHVIPLTPGERFDVVAIDAWERRQSAPPPVLDPLVLGWWWAKQPRMDAPLAEWRRWIRFLDDAIELSSNSADDGV